MRAPRVWQPPDRNNRWTRRCRECWHTATEKLPPVERRAVYLDQMVLSNMAKALDPVWRATRGKQDPFWAELFRAARLDSIYSAWWFLLILLFLVISTTL